MSHGQSKWLSKLDNRCSAENPSLGESTKDPPCQHPQLSAKISLSVLTHRNSSLLKRCWDGLSLAWWLLRFPFLQPMALLPGEMHYHQNYCLPSKSIMPQQVATTCHHDHIHALTRDWHPDNGGSRTFPRTRRALLHLRSLPSYTGGADYTSSPRILTAFLSVSFSKDYIPIPLLQGSSKVRLIYHKSKVVLG